MVSHYNSLLQDTSIIYSYFVQHLGAPLMDQDTIVWGAAHTKEKAVLEGLKPPNQGFIEWSED